MKLRYETGVGTLVQFLVMVALNFIGMIISSVQGCFGGTGGCVGNMLIDLIYFLLISAWFGFIWVLGYAAQDRRSRRLAQALILAEGLVVLVSLFDAKHYPSIFGLLTSLIDCLLAIWVLVLAVRLMRADGGRIVSGKAGVRRRSVAEKIKK